MQKLTLSEIKTIKGLSQKKNRDESGLFVVEGEKMVSEAQAAGFEVGNRRRADETHLFSRLPLACIGRGKKGKRGQARH